MHKTVIIADEAHRLNVDTRKKLKKSDEDNIRNWETAVQSAINAKSNKSIAIHLFYWIMINVL